MIIKDNDSVGENQPEVKIPLDSLNKDLAKKVAAKSVASTNNSSKSSAKDRVFNAVDLLNQKLEVIPYLVESIFPKVGIGAIAGGSDTGKSSLLRQLAVDIVTGKSNFLNWEIRAEHQKAIYVSTEDNDQAIAFLLNKQFKSRGVRIEQYEGLDYLFEIENLLNDLEELLENNPVDLIVIDAFTDVFGQQLNQSNQVRSFLNGFSQLAQKHQLFVLFLHHTGKRTEFNLPSKHNLLGSQAFEAKMRVVLELRTDQVDIHSKHLCIVKGNYIPPEVKQSSYVLKMEEDLSFTTTGQTRDFTEIVWKDFDSENKKEIKEDERTKKYNRILELRAAGMTNEEVAKEMGCKTGQAVSQYVSRYQKKNGIINP